MTKNISSSKEFFNKAAFFCGICFMIFIPSSTALMNIFIFLTLIFSLLAGNLKKSILLIWKNPVAKAALILFALLSVSISWSIVEETSEGLRVLKKYNELWYIALLLPLFNTDVRRDIGINAYIVSMAIVLIGVYLVYFEIILPFSWTIKGHYQSFTVDGGFASHVITNILMAFAMFIAAHKSILTKSLWRIFYFVFFVFSFYYVLFISTGTSGQILAILLLFLFIIQHSGVRAIFLIPVLLILIGSITIIPSNGTAKSNTNSILFAIDKLGVRYHHLTSSDTAGYNTRPRIYINALKLITHKPFIGSGVGGFEKSFRTYEPEFYKLTSTGKRNSHNEFLMISVQLGVAGLLLLLYLFYMQAACTNRIRDREYKYIAQGLVILIIIGCMGNSMILDSREGHFWAFFSALLFSKLENKI
jgi:O-antigen ligase